MVVLTRSWISLVRGSVQFLTHGILVIASLELILLVLTWSWHVSCRVDRALELNTEGLALLLNHLGRDAVGVWSWRIRVVALGAAAILSSH